MMRTYYLLHLHITILSCNVITAFGIHGGGTSQVASSTALPGGNNNSHNDLQPSTSSSTSTTTRILEATTALHTDGDDALTTAAAAAEEEEEESNNDYYPSFPKTEEESEFIRTALQDKFMFSTLPDDSLDRLIQAFEKITVTRSDGEAIVNQGDSCDNSAEDGSNTECFVYLIESGHCNVWVNNQLVPEPYGTLQAGAVFGELGILYNRPRSATVTAKSAVVSLFRVRGDIFKSVLHDSTYQETEMSNADLLHDIDEAINQVSGTSSKYNGRIIRPYRPNRRWLWRRIKGTVFQQTYKTVVVNMLASAVFIVFTRRLTDRTWTFGLRPDHTDPFIARLELVRKLWSYQMSLTTFLLTFFVNQAYSFWYSIYDIARGIQGRLNDFHLLLATSARRNADGSYTRESQQLLDDIGSFGRLFHILFWASSARRFRILATPLGLQRMASRGLMTSKQLQVLQHLDVPETQRHHACLEWMMIRAWQGIDDGTLRVEPSLSDRLMEQLCRLRGTYASTGDKLDARMPLPYTHFVQILVDVFVALSPVALYPELGAYSIYGVGVLTLFYSGLLDLAKVFLDPLDNEDFTKESINMDVGVLIRESNGASVRWKNCGAQLPFRVRQPSSTNGAANVNPMHIAPAVKRTAEGLI